MQIPSNRQRVAARWIKIALLFAVFTTLAFLLDNAPIWAKLGTSLLASVIIAIATDPDGIFGWFACHENNDDIYELQ